MVNKVKINDFLIAFQEIEGMYKQNLQFNIGTAVKLLEFYKYADDINSYVLNRIKTLIPNIGKEGYELSDDEYIVYSSILNSDIDFDNHGLTKEELLDNPSVKVGLLSFDKLLHIL